MRRNDDNQNLIPKSCQRIEDRIQLLFYLRDASSRIAKLEQSQLKSSILSEIEEQRACPDYQSVTDANQQLQKQIDDLLLSNQLRADRESKGESTSEALDSIWPSVRGLLAVAAVVYIVYSCVAS
jgi:cell division FtsZ-interacting protein ZapD